MTTSNIFSGVSTGGFTLNNGDILNVFSGGTVSDITISAGGTETLSGGVASDTMVYSGGVVTVSAGGTAYATVMLNSSAVVHVSSGGRVSGTVLSGGSETVFSGATASDNLISRGGTETVHGIETGATVFAGGYQFIGQDFFQDGGVASGTLVMGEEDVGGDGITYGTILTAGGMEDVQQGPTARGSALGTIVDNGGELQVGQSGYVLNAVVNSGGIDLFDAIGGIDSGTMVYSGGMLETYGTTISTTIFPGGMIDLVRLPFSGTTSAVVNTQSNLLTVSEGRTSFQEQLAGDYTGLIFSAGVDSSGSGTLLTLISGTASAGHTATTYNVTSGITSSGITLSQGDFLNVSSAGTASAIVVSNGATENVRFDGVARGTLVYSGGIENISAGGSAYATVTLNSSAMVNVSSGGRVSGTVLSGGSETVFSGATASGTLISLGGIETVHGIETGATVFAGGYQFVGQNFSQDGGVASGTLVLGEEDIGGDGITYGTILTAGGVELVQQGPTERGSAIGTIVDSGGELDMGQSGYALNPVINSGGLEFFDRGGSIVSGTMVMSGGTLETYQSNDEVGTTVFLGGMIDLPLLAFSGITSAVVNPQTDLLTVNEGSGGYQRQLAGDYTGLIFSAGPDAGSGTLLTLVNAPPCYVAGTRIATTVGEIAVESLRAGDWVTLYDGRTAPIVWIGHRHLDCTRHPDPKLVWPVRVAAGAFAPGVPERDLLLSPDHAIYVADVFIPVRYLINETSIARVEMAEVTYFHVELPTHDVIMAEGLPTESYLDTGDRANFDNGGGPTRLYPDFRDHVWETRGYAPLRVTGPEIEATRRMLRERSAVLKSEARTAEAWRASA